MSPSNIRTCQICGRAVKTVQAYPIEAVDSRRSRAFQIGETIAHHGYRRPGDGWQTSSCAGARWRPYEIACDALPVIIASCERHIDSVVFVLNEWRISPPAAITVDELWAGRSTGKTITHDRPDDYDAMRATETGGSYIPNTYDAEFKKRQWARLRDIKGTKETLQFMQQRVADWPDRKRKIASPSGKCLTSVE